MKNTLLKPETPEQLEAESGSSAPTCSASIDWYPGPAQDGGGTAGGEYWNDGDTLLIVVELRGGASEVVCVNVSADEGRADMTLQSTGDDTGWTLSDISWWAILNGKFPKQKDQALPQAGRE